MATDFLKVGKFGFEVGKLQRRRWLQRIRIFHAPKRLQRELARGKLPPPGSSR